MNRISYRAVLYFVLVMWGMSIVLAHAKSIYAEDAFVHMIERHLSANANFSIGPGVTITSMECNCTIKYLGTRIDGNHYHVDIDKLD